TAHAPVPGQHGVDVAAHAGRVLGLVAGDLGVESLDLGVVGGHSLTSSESVIGRNRGSGGGSGCSAVGAQASRSSTSSTGVPTRTPAPPTTSASTRSPGCSASSTQAAVIGARPVKAGPVMCSMTTNVSIVPRPPTASNPRSNDQQYEQIGAGKCW